jgi:uncharacterized membrane protein
MNAEQRANIARAIKEAEAKTTGRIVVRVIPDRSVDAFERAKYDFGRAGLHHHATRNAALILVAPKAQRFAVLGDRALHERVGDAFWRDVVDEARPYFSRGALEDGVLHAVARIGAALHEYFPEPIEAMPS